MMQKRDFLRFIEDNNFYELFIECGWNNPQGDTDLGGIEEDGIAYRFEQIAERNGFKIVKCEVKAIPNPSLCKKIDHYLRRLANDYICVFLQVSPWYHMWLVPVNKVDKRDLVRVEYSTLDQASFLYEKVSGFSFEFGTKTNIVDVREKVQKAFLVDSEKVTKKFYEEFRKQHKLFTSFITGIDDFIDEENKTRPKNKQVENKNKQWYASIMLNRLMFCYFIQRKRFLDGRTDYLRYKLKEVKEQEGDDQFYSFYRSFLIHLFHEGINTPRHDSPEFLKRYGRIPYLNGGLFGEHELELKYDSIDISDEAFEKLFAFFDQWNWHLDTSLTASGKDINPDVLGYIFEQYINDRAAMGAYYTKEDITEYIGRNTILPFLMDATRKTDERAFKPNGEVWQFLRQSGDTYIFDDVKKGKDEQIPEEIAIGIDIDKPNLHERRIHWNEKTPENLALPTEIWRETIERLQRYDSIKEKIESGSITDINDFITYNLDIRLFVRDLLSKTDNHLLVKHFYEQLRRITILDPTCGSGAFLFAAMNILEPLYEICIDRMEDWHKTNSNLFKDEIEEIDCKYRSNRQYFIYKSIILRNLYGVDIMVEATEIAKLRLFLKMVAVVEVDLRADNLGLDPLPDIDFNIRCGNTLVGYATDKELDYDLKWGDAFANKNFRKDVEDGMDKAAHAFALFKKVQFTQEEDLDAFKKAKEELRNRLKELNDALNHRLYSSTTDATILSYNAWEERHQPFHWLAEFYEIMHDNGGFDVIIGNPPYVTMSNINYIKNTKEFKCSDLYGHVIRRVLTLINSYSRQGFIVMHNLAFSRNFVDVRKVLMKRKGCQWYSFYSRIPSGLFSGDVRVRNCIYILSPSGKQLYTSRLHRWFTEQRECLFTTEMNYVEFENNGCIPMLHSKSLQKIYERSNGIHLSQLERQDGKTMYYKKVGYNFLSISDVQPPAYDEFNKKVEQTGLDFVNFDKEYYEVIILLLCGKFYLSKWLTYGDDFHVTSRDIIFFSFPFDSISESDIKTLHECYLKIVKRLPETIQFKLNAGINVGTFNTSLLWDITDISDMIFFKYISDTPNMLMDSIDSHISKCVISGKV